MLESKAELKLLKSLKMVGFWAKHMDTSIPGFPDIMAVRNDKVFLIEVKVERSGSIGAVMERTQPALIQTLENFGFKNVFLACCSEDGVALYDTSNILDKIMKDEVRKATDLPELVRGTYDHVASWLAGDNR